MYAGTAGDTAARIGPTIKLKHYSKNDRPTLDKNDEKHSSVIYSFPEMPT